MTGVPAAGNPDLRQPRAGAGVRVARSVPAVVAAAIGAFAVTLLYHTTWHLWRFSWTTLYGDQWRIYSGYLRNPLPEALFLVQNQHRPIFPGLLYALDFFYLGASNRLLIAASLGLLVSFLLLISLWIWRQKELAAPLRGMLVAVLWVSQWWLGNFRVLAHGNGGLHAYPIFLLLAFGVWAIDRRSRASGLAAGAWTAAAATSAFVATFTYSFGVVIWPVLVFAALLLRVPWKTVLAMVASAGASLLLYLGLLPQTEAVGAARPRPLQMLVDAAVWLGSPFHHVRWGFSPDPLIKPDLTLPLTAGAVASAIALLLLANALWKARSLSRIELWCLAAIAFALGCAVLVAYGRGGYFAEHPNQRLAHRYIPWSMVLWAHLILLAGLWVGRAKRLQGVAVAGYSIALATILAFLVPSQRSYAAILRLTDGAIKESSLALGLGIDSQKTKALLWPDVRHVERVAGYLRAQHSGMFGWETTRRMGDRLPEPSALSGNLCGAIDRVAPLEDAEGHALRFTGWMLGDEAGTRPLHLLVIDESSTVRGAALFTRVLHTPKSGRSLFVENNGFVGFASEVPPDEDLRAVGVLPDGRFVQLGALRAGRTIAPCPATP